MVRNQVTYNAKVIITHILQLLTSIIQKRKIPNWLHHKLFFHLDIKTKKPDEQIFFKKTLFRKLILHKVTCNFNFRAGQGTDSFLLCYILEFLRFRGKERPGRKGHLVCGCRFSTLVTRCAVEQLRNQEKNFNF